MQFAPTNRFLTFRTFRETPAGSQFPLTEPSIPGGGFNVLSENGGFDDGGVADLQLIIDLNDNVLRRIKGTRSYLTLSRNDSLPRARKHDLGKLSRAEQKSQLAQLLFCEDPEDEDRGPSEAFYVHDNIIEDDKSRTHKKLRLMQAMAALRLSIMLREAGCVSLSLSELCKRRLQCIEGGGAAALRAADLSIDIAGQGEWDPDLVVLEAEEEASFTGESLGKGKVPNRSQTGLANPKLCPKYINPRVSVLCRRAGILQRGNALQALKRFDEAEAAYNECLSLLESEIRCARTDWERHSVFLNLGNTRLAALDVEGARRHYESAHAFGREHLSSELGSRKDGRDMVRAAKLAKARAAKHSGDTEQCRKLMEEIVVDKREEMEEAEKEKAKEEAEKAKAEGAESPAQVAASA